MKRYQAVVEAYNALRRKRGVPIDHSQLGVNVVNQFIVWCDEREIDPVQFIELVGPELDRVPRMRWFGTERTERIWDEVSFDDQMTSDGVKPVEPELWYVAERLKQRYVHVPDLCIIRMRFTGGFTPRSRVCSACPKQERCREIRLRRGFSKSVA